MLTTRACRASGHENKTDAELSIWTVGEGFKERDKVVQ